MNAAPAVPRPWSRSRWFVSISAVFLAQVGLLFAFYRHPVIAPPAHAPVLSRSLVEGPEELLALYDPTFSILPHREGFSGEAWLKASRLQFQSTDWSERPRLLPWIGQRPGLDFQQSVRSNALAGFQPLAIPEPEPLPAYSAASPIATSSKFRIGGPLKNRRLLVPPQLPAWTNADPLPNSIVQIEVNAQGDTISAVWLPSRASSQTDADKLAPRLARSVRFESVLPAGSGRSRSPSAELMTGTITFEWLTLPVPPTNAPAGGS